MSKVCGIYCFENIINGHKYAGQSNNIESRKRNHLSTLKNGKDDCLVFQNAYNKYGENSFNFWIVEECSLELLNERETFWIKELHSHVSENGYNVSYGGDSGMRGRTHSEESRKKISEWQRGENGYWYGKKLPKETLDKMRDANSGEKNPNYGKDPSQETRMKMSASAKIAKQGIKKSPIYTSKYVGVHKHQKNNNSWCASISLLNNENIFLGCFKTEIEAALAYNEMAIEEYGWKARLNIISKEEIEKNWNLEIKDRPFLEVGSVQKNSSSKYAGVSYDYKKNKWICTVRYLDGRMFFGGRFNYEIEAAMVWNESMLEEYGYKINDRLNIITPEEIENLWNLN